MRKILFRGKRIDNGEWVYGSYCYAELLDHSGYEHLIIEASVDGGSHRVIPETVGQYTGLTDKNGRQIFEGDIVITQPFSDKPFSRNAKYKQHIGVVEYHVSHFKNDCYEQDYEGKWTVDITDYGKYDCYNWSKFYRCEVVGNIYDNSTLLSEERVQTNENNKNV